LAEIIKSNIGGQIFFSVTKPGITRGNHFHRRKIERFCVVEGKAVIKLRIIGTEEVIEYRVRGDKPSFIDIPVFHTHNITNTGTKDLYTLFWTNEFFDPENSDTYYEEVG
jgi:UDP-2-acetamido-2,6-beta-L-arabino-hexul-4-ose reductase